MRSAGGEDASIQRAVGTFQADDKAKRRDKEAETTQKTSSLFLPPGTEKKRRAPLSDVLARAGEG